MVWRYGDHRAGGCDTAYPRRGWDAALSRRNARPLKDNKMRPRIAETAKTLWLIYVLLTVACALALWFAGMDAFDAIGHSFATIAIGGFSTHDASIGYFDSPTINTIIAIFLLISGCNYGLHFSLLSGRSLKVYWRDPEFRMFIGVQFSLVVICTLVLWFHNVYSSALMTINQAFFQVVSMATTAGFTTDSIAAGRSFCRYCFYVQLLSAVAPGQRAVA
ncbi:trk system potassium uptake protein TrkH [Escherichia coli]|uniref:Trk system potassium uptake protein TrkH n=1 Tax=Escherichia coli TaxID=562 RepID=A0A484Y1Q5_ECOLX|nr:trk system potassium uptake protein TrkH [Escherichia coli]